MLDLGRQPGIDEVNFLSKQSVIITAGRNSDIHRDHNLTKTCDKRLINHRNDWI